MAKETELTGLTKDTWRYYMVTLQFRDTVAAGIPLDAHAVDGWLASRVKAGKLTDEEAARIKSEMDLDLGLTNAREKQAEKAEEGGVNTAPLCVFKTREGHPYIEARQVKAMLRDAGRVLEWTKIHGFGHGIKEGTGVYPIPQDATFGDHTTIFLHKTDGKGKDWVATAADVETERRVIHVMTAQGPRSSFKWNEKVREGRISFILRTAYKALSKEAVVKLFDVGTECGLGADRATCEGSFNVVSLKEMDDGDKVIAQVFKTA